MEKIASFTVDHIKLQPGIYVSRKDTVGQEVITTFDLRMTSPNEEPVMNTAEMHTIEHLGATFLRNHPVYKDKTIYFGPMGCRTGFYMLLAGDYTSKDVVGLVTELFEFVRDFKGEVPGAACRWQIILERDIWSRFYTILKKTVWFIRSKIRKEKENGKNWYYRRHGAGS